MRLNEESRISFIKFHMERFAKVVEEHTLSTTEFLSGLSNSLYDIQVSEDMKCFDDRFNYVYENNIRLPKEEFVNYDIQRRNCDTKAHPSLVDSQEHMATTESSKGDFEEETDDLESDAKVIVTFFKNIRTQDIEVSMEELSFIIKNLHDDVRFAQLMVDKMLIYYKTNLFVQIPNYQNFHHFAHILISISNCIEIFKELFEMNYAIIYISEKTYHVNNDNQFNKIYICSYLASNKLFTTKQTWLQLINIKLNTLTEERVEKALSGQEDWKTSNPAKTGLIVGIKNYFGNSSKKPPVNMNQLPDQTIQKIKSHEAAIVLREYIQHFACFNYDVAEATEIILELSDKYNINREKVRFYISLLNSNIYTIKNKSFTKKVDYEKLYLNKNYNSYKGLNDHKMSTIAVSFKYLDLKDLGNILLLNSSYHKKLSKTIYKNILFKYHNMDNRLRLAIWGSLLNIVWFIFNLG